MASKYSVVQYSPDPLADERINIGVIVTSGEVVRARFLNDWTRVRHFSGHDVTFLKHFAKTIGQAATPQEILPNIVEGRFTASLLEGASEAWMNSIQFTPLRGSLKAIDDLLAEVSVRFLAKYEQRRRELRDRRYAASAAAAHIREALLLRVGPEAEDLLKKRHRLQGKLQPHRFDAVVANGVPYFAAQGISFEIAGNSNLQRDTEALAWQITDVRALDSVLPLAVVAFPPVENTAHLEKAQQLYDEAVGVYAQLGATVLDENSVAGWARHVVSRLPA
jgi:hypothetical protein